MSYRSTLSRVDHVAATVGETKKSEGAETTSLAPRSAQCTVNMVNAEWETEWVSIDARPTLFSFAMLSTPEFRERCR